MCFGGGGSFPDPPDMSQLYDSIDRQIALMEKFGERAFEFQEEVYADQKAVLDDILGIQLPLMEDQAGWAREFQDRYNEYFAPIEEGLAEMATTYDTPERRQKEAARAIGDVSMAYESQRENAMRELEGYGIDPSQVQRQALDQEVRIAEAANAAAAGTQARRTVEDVGRALQFNVANIGRGFPGNTAQFSQGATSTGGTASQAQTGQAQAFLPIAGNPLPYMQGALQGSIGKGGLMNDVYGTQMRGYGYDQAYGGDVASSIGQVAGTGLGMWAGAGFPGFQEGGVVPEPSGAMPAERAQAIPTAGPTDKTPAALTPGEYVVPADVVRWKGEEFFEKLQTKSREGREVAIDTQRNEQATQAARRPRPDMSPNVARLNRMRGSAPPQKRAMAVA